MNQEFHEALQEVELRFDIEAYPAGVYLMNVELEEERDRKILFFVSY